MRLKDFVTKTRMVDLEVFPQDRLDELLAVLEKDPSMASMGDSWFAATEAVPQVHLQRLSDACRAWQDRERALAALLDLLRDRKLPEPPGDVLERAMVPHKIAALERAVSLCPRDGFDGDAEWTDALDAHLQAWSGAVNLAIKRGQLHCRLDTEHAEANRFQDYARRRENLSGLPGHRWLAMRRGERLGALDIDFEWPMANITALVDSLKSRMGAAVPENLTEIFVTSHLTEAVRAVLDRRVEDEAIKSAVTQYAELLNSPRFCDAPVGAVAVLRSDAELGVAVLDGHGKLLAGILVEPGQDRRKDIVDFLFQHRIEQVVLPNTAPDREFLAEVRSGLAEQFAVITVRTAALAEARRQIREADRTIAAPIASAMVLARRALDPGAEWAKVNPVGLGLADYQHDIDVDHLHAALCDALALHVRKNRPASGRGAEPRLRTAQVATKQKAKPNPLVGSIADLRPGMTVHGTISNVTRFGVFVDMGLEEDAMIHISELSSEFVSNPEDVVSMGQEVSARVLEVDSDKKRVALTLKTADPDGANRSHRRRERPHDRPKSKSDALAQLENLFKK
ncbi:MAG: S1 RNA-binding domain-containing protein [Deltaproteobacteria bacterium]|nr:S1 RNA-binding domain-containing protein [Deltaproteobacteria bacterium]